MSSIILKSSLGFSAGFLAVFLGVPENSWGSYRSNVVQPITGAVKSAYGLYVHYSPQEWNKRKSQEAFDRNPNKLTNIVQIVESEEEKEHNNKRVLFFAELTKRIRLAEMGATQRGLSRKDREEIIKETLEEFFPEMFPNAVEIVRKQLEREAHEEIQ